MALRAMIEEMNELSNAGRISLQTRERVLREIIESYRVCKQQKGYENRGCPLLERVINGETTFTDELNNALMQRRDEKFISDNVSIFGYDTHPARMHVETIDDAIKYVYRK
ncbi:MAG: hypothetical protein V1734_03970 [Nanoarchaeota archaeon]